jgi:hypothetical protein
MLPAAGPAALRPCRATAAPGSRRTRGNRRGGHAPQVQRWCPARKRGHPSGAPILKPCKFAVKPARDRGATATVELPGARISREAGLDRAFDKESGGTGRRDGQDRALPSQTCGRRRIDLAKVPVED